MASFATLKATIQQYIKQNGTNAITGNLLQQQLLAMINSLGANYQYAGIATPDTNPGTPDQNVFYIAAVAGNYANFNNTVVKYGEIAILKYNGTWQKDETGIAMEQSLPTFNLVGNGNNVVYSSQFKVKAGNKYILYVKDINISMDGVSAQAGFRLVVRAFTAAGVFVGYLVAIAVPTALSNYYEFTAPDNADYIQIRMRAAASAQQIFWVQDITILSIKRPTEILVGSDKFIDSDILARNIGGIIRPDSQNQRYINTNVNVGDVVNLTPQVSSGNYKYSITKVNPGDVIIINGVGGGDARLWAFIDNQNRLLLNSDANISQSNFELIAPPNSVAIIINSTSVTDCYLISGAIKDVNDTLYSFQQQIGSVLPITDTGKYLETGTPSVGQKISLKPVTSASLVYYTIMRVNPNDSFIINGFGGEAPALWCFVDVNFVILSKSIANLLASNLEITAPANAAYLIINNKQNRPCYFNGQSQQILQNTANIGQNAQTLNKLYSEIEFKNNVYYNVNGFIGDVLTLAETANDSYKAAIVSCQPGDFFIVNATAGGVSAKAFVFVDSQNRMLEPFATIEYKGVVVVPDNAAKIVISTYNKTLQSYAGSNAMLIDTRARVLKQESTELDYSSIQQFCSNGVFSPFRIVSIYYANCPIIISARAKYTTTGDKPTIRFECGFYSSIWYTIGGDGKFETKDWRVPPPMYPDWLRIELRIPAGCTLEISNFSSNKDRTVGKPDVGVRFDAHLGFLSVAPENTMAAYEAAARCGYGACIVNPIFNFENEPYCYHEDTACLSYQGGTNPVELSAEQFAELTQSDMADYRVIGFGNMRKYFNEPIPRLDDFFYLCSVTGMRPMFSTHPTPTDEQWLIIKELLKKYNLLDKIIIKAFSVAILERAFAILGNVYGFIYDVGGTNADGYCDELDNSTLTQFKGGIGVEYQVSVITKQVVETTISRGYFCSVWSVSNITGERYKELIKWGVSEFTDDFNCCSGLNF